MVEDKEAAVELALYIILNTHVAIKVVSKKMLYIWKNFKLFLLSLQHTGGQIANIVIMFLIIFMWSSFKFNRLVILSGQLQ